MNLKVLTLNVWDGGRMFNEVINFIKFTDADIVLLQEVYDGQDGQLEPRLRSLDVYKTELDYAYHDYAPQFIDNRTNGKFPQGNAIFSKLPIIDRRVTFFDRPFDEHYVELPENYPTISRNVEHVTLHSPVGNIDCFNFHGVWDLDGDNFSETRKKMSDVLLTEIEGKERVILGGDTNAKPTNKCMTALEDSLQSVFGTSLQTTFNMLQKSNPGYATAAVDMLFVSHNINIVDTDCPAVNISDHLPLIANLEL